MKGNMSGSVAPYLSQEEWSKLYYNYSGTNTLPMLNAGADETKLSLCWHAAKVSAVPEVRLSENSDMSNFVLFKGKITPAENKEQLVCRVTLEGLKENTEYYYQWYSENGWSEICGFATKSFSVHKAVIVGDIQISEIREGSNNDQISDGHNWNNLLSNALNLYPDISLLLTPGDNTSTGKTAQEWQTLLTPVVMRSLPMAMAIGNHDKKGFTYNYYTNMPNEYFGKHFAGLDRDFWFRYGDVLYLFYDSTSGNAPDHMAMTKTAVEKNADAKWRIGVVHHGIYGAGDCIGDAETEILLSSIFTPIFETFDLDFVITGHTHSQGRSHFMERRKKVGEALSGGKYTNPAGIVYLNSNSVCPREYMDYSAGHLAYSFLENDCITYSVLSFEGDTMTMETRRGDNNALLDSLTIVRTAEHNENSSANRMRRIMYKFVEFAGFVYTKADNLVREINSRKK